jgi:diguanylate cyclase (GGDEF)-like protein
MRHTRLFTSKHSFFCLLFLVALAFLGNLLNLSLFFGVDFIFGSIFVLLIIKRYGFKWGLVGSIIASSYTLLLWNHPYALMVFIFETIFIGVLHRKKESNLVLLVALFWVFLGMPMIWFSYHYGLHMNATATLTIMLKDAVNGIFNSLIASLILTYLPSSAWGDLNSKKSSTSFSQLLFNIFVALIVFPMLLVMILVGQGEFKKIETEIQKSAEVQSEVILNDITNWRNAQVTAVVQLSKLASETRLKEVDSLQQFTTYFKDSFPDFHSMYITDSTGAALTFYPLHNQSGMPTLGLNFSDRPYFKEMKSHLQPVISDVFIGRGSVTKPIVNVGAPIIIDQHFQGIASGALDLGYINEKIKKLTNKTKINVTIVDRNHHVIASTKPTLTMMQEYDWQKGGEVQALNGDFYHWFPNNIKNPMNHWGGSSYVKVIPLSDHTDWTIIMESPVSPYRDDLYNSYIKILSILLICGLIAIVISIFISRLIVKPITQLADTTTDLPDKILGKEPVHWPTSIMAEIAILINNFKNTAERLQKMFHDIQYFAYYDSLTNLPNRVLFNQQLEAVLEKTKMYGQTSAVLFVDLDRFKVVNDTLGHGHGDLLLQIVAQRLRNCIESNDILSRMGGDEFTAVLSNINREQTAALAQRMLDAFSQPIDISGHEVFITPSIGISLFPDDGLDHQTLIKNADQAMYAAKDKGKNKYQFYASEMNETSSHKMNVETMMHKALDNHEFELYYQPKIHIETGVLTGLEALIRWRHPEKGWITPIDFIPIAEDTGLINPIGEWVLRTACAQNKAWQDAGYPSVSVSVNLSVRQMKEQSLVHLITQVLRETGLDPQYLELEITENISMHNMNDVLSTLHEIKRLGVKIAMDDFGTGYSSLSYLKKFPIDHLKIDQSFIRDIQLNQEDHSIVKAIIAMAHSLGMIVIAEGVETEAQSALLREMKCNEIQGYFISKPFPPENFSLFLAARNNL